MFDRWDSPGSGATEAAVTGALPDDADVFGAEGHPDEKAATTIVVAAR